MTSLFLGLSGLCLLASLAWCAYAFEHLNRAKRIRSSAARREAVAVAAEKRALQGLRMQVSALDEMRRVEQSAKRALTESQRLLQPRPLTRDEREAYVATIDLPLWMQFKTGIKN